MAANGPGATKLKQAIAYENSCKITFVDIIGQTKAVNIVMAYKHLGSKRGSSESMAPEIRARCATIAEIKGKVSKKILANGCGRSCSSFHSCKKILANDKVSCKAKVNVMNAYLCSRTLFNAGTWPMLTNYEAVRLHTEIMKLARCIAWSEQTKGGQERRGSAGVAQRQAGAGDHGHRGPFRHGTSASCTPLGPYPRCGTHQPACRNLGSCKG